MNRFIADHGGAIVCPSPNFGKRRDVRGPDILLIHYTAMETSDAALRWLCSEKSQVSAHYLIDESGQITQMVRECDRAWHAGQSIWQGETDINSRSIGIEIANRGHEGGSPPYPAAQVKSLIALSQSVVMRYHILPERVLAHSDVAPARKRDPGEWFPWEELYRAGIGHYVKPTAIKEGPYFMAGQSGQSIRNLQSMLGDYGYGAQITGDYDQATEANIIAFQRHFRPEKVDGIADISTIDTLYRLLEALKENAKEKKPPKVI